MGRLASGRFIARKAVSTRVSKIGVRQISPAVKSWRSAFSP